MNATSLKEIIKSATARNITLYESKFAPMSLDKEIFDVGGTTFKDRVVQRVFDDPVYDDRGFSALLDSEIASIFGESTIALDCEELRKRAEQGRGWISTLDIRR